MTLAEFSKAISDYPTTPIMPALFVGHGSPMNGLEDNEYSRAWQMLGTQLPRPRAILAISAHWLTEGTAVHVAAKPKTIHDFWGFPKELYDLTYPCPGAPELARATQKLITKTNIETDTEWGIDHGTWIVLHRMYSDANIPVFQMSIDFSKPSNFHYELGKELRPLREHGILVMGSGNIVHNLSRVDFNENAKAFDWALEFDEKSKTLIEAGNHGALAHYEKLGSAAHLAIPTPDHYYPLLYTLGLQQRTDRASFPISGITHGSVSMRAVLLEEIE